MIEVLMSKDLPLLEKKLKKAEEKCNLLQKQIRTETRNSEVVCVGNIRRGSLLDVVEGCGKHIRISEISFLQKYYYVNEPYNEHHVHSGGAFICPDCGVKTHVREGSEIDKLSYFFKDRKDY